MMSSPLNADAMAVFIFFRTSRSSCMRGNDSVLHSRNQSAGTK